MNVLLLTSHAIAEHDDLDMFTRMGVPCFSIGGAYDPVPFEGKRPAVTGAPRFPELEAAVRTQREMLTERLGDPGPRIDWGKAVLPADVLDWADTIIVHHFPEWWIGGQWDRIRRKRVIWRTCGQSDVRLERVMHPLRRQGMQIVRYSPRERIAFEGWGAFAGEDALIRFGKDPADFLPWTGEDAVVANVTQDMIGRGDACGYGFWQAATEGLPVKPAGPGSENMRGGIGALPYDAMRAYLASSRVYLYTGTRPASYTLGLIEAAMTGIPVVTIGPVAFGCGDLFEWDVAASDGPFDDPVEARKVLLSYLEHPAYQRDGIGGRSPGAVELNRERAIRAFGIEGVMADWRSFLGLVA